MTEEMVALLLFLSVFLAYAILREWVKLVQAKKDLVIERQKLSEMEASLMETVSEHVRTVEKIIDEDVPK